jgi:cell division GTPase FtsZ
MSDADVKLDVGRELTRGLGAGALRRMSDLLFGPAGA